MPTHSLQPTGDPPSTVLPTGSTPLSSKVAGALAALACFVACAVPLLIVAGILTGAGAVLLQHTLFAAAVGLVVAALTMWWLHHRRTRQTDQGR